MTDLYLDMDVEDIKPKDFLEHFKKGLGIDCELLYTRWHFVGTDLIMSVQGVDPDDNEYAGKVSLETDDGVLGVNLTYQKFKDKVLEAEYSQVFPKSITSAFSDPNVLSVFDVPHITKGGVEVQHISLTSKERAMTYIDNMTDDPQPDITLRSDMTVEMIRGHIEDEMVMWAAWVSNNKTISNDPIDQKRLKGLINSLVREGHTSTLEHSQATFLIEAPIFVAREFMRHRTMSYNEMSGRYTMMEPVFYIPGPDRPLVNSGTSMKPIYDQKDIDGAKYANAILSMSSVYRDAWAEYNHMIQSGIAMEVARNVLPLAIYTKFYATTDMNNWFKFLFLRDGLNGHPLQEIQMVANPIKDSLRELAPITMAAWEKYRKVDPVE